MSERMALPIGSVVRVREGVEPVMIVNHCLSRYDEEVSKITYDHFTIEDFKK